MSWTAPFMPLTHGSQRPRALLVALLTTACAPADFDDLVLHGEQGDPIAACEGGARPEADADACTSTNMDAASPEDGGHDGASSDDAGGAHDRGSSAGDADASMDARSGDAEIEPTACDASAACEPGETREEREPCGPCGTGTRTRTRSCSATTCSWTAWTPWSACMGVTAACSPGETSACSPSDSCGERVCSDGCTWSACVPIVPNGCLRRRGSQEEGSNFRCCGPEQWQFCLPSCEWSNDCTPCSPGLPDLCTEC